MEIINFRKKKESLLSRLRSYMESIESAKQDKLKKENFLKELSMARDDLQAARANYNFAEEPEVLEYYIYAIKAAETRLNFCLQRAKKENLSNDGFLAEQFFRMRRGEEIL